MTFQQQEELRAVYSFIAKCLLAGEAPDFVEIAVNVKASLKSVIRSCRFLRAQGFIDFTPGQSRSFRITKEWPAVAGVVCSRTGRIFGFDFFEKVER